MSRPYRSPGASAAPPELHEGFQGPRRVPATDLERFLEEADRLEGIREIQRAMRRAIEPGRQVLDAGCGIGLETTRLAAAHLAPGPSGDAAASDAGEMLRTAIPQPLAGRRIPGLLTARGLGDVAGTPFAFAPSEPVWRRIVAATLTAVAPPGADITAWLRERGRGRGARGVRRGVHRRPDDREEGLGMRTRSSATRTVRPVGEAGQRLAKRAPPARRP